MRQGILGIDFGTTKLAAVLIDPESGKLLDSRSVVTGADLALPQPARKEQDPARIEQVLRRVVTELLAATEVRLRCLGLTGQMHGILGLNGRGRPVSNLVTWQDGRGEEEAAPGTTLLEEMRRRLGPGLALASGYGIVTLFHWLKQGLPPRLAGVCTLADYFAMRLTGCQEPVSDPTMAESLGCYDLATRSWSAALLDKLEIPARLLPRVSRTTTVIGELQATWLRDLAGSGRDPVPVGVAIGDNQASYLGSVREHFDSILLNIGTGSQICFAIPGYPPASLQSRIDGYDVTLRPFVGPAHLVAGSALSGGVVYQALRDFFAAVGKDLFGIDPPPDLYARMEAAAEEAAAALAEQSGERRHEQKRGPQGLLVRPLFAGSRSDPTARGTIAGLSPETFSPGQLVYATLEGVIRILKDLVDPFGQTQRKFLVGGGNGLRHNPLLRRIAAGLFQREILVPEHPEEAAVGAALNGAVAGGVFRSFEEAKEVIHYP